MVGLEPIPAPDRSPICSNDFKPRSESGGIVYTKKMDHFKKKEGNFELNENQMHPVLILIILSINKFQLRCLGP